MNNRATEQDRQDRRREARPRWRVKLGSLAGQFFAVFLGVTLSFVADDLREDLARQREERLLLEAIREDLRRDLPIVASIARLDSAAAAGAQWLHSNWDSTLLSTDSIAQALQPQYSARVYAPVRAAYESAKGAGRFEYISNRTLRHLIGGHYETGQGEEKAVNDLVISSLLDLHRTLRPYVHFASDFPPVCCAPAVSLSLPWPSVQSDVSLRNSLIGSEMFRRLSHARMRSFERSIEELDSLISEELQAR